MAKTLWSIEDLREALDQYETDLRRAGLRDLSVRTYLEQSERFLRWLSGQYRPNGPVREKSGD